MAENTVTITRYGRDAINQMEAAFRAAGGSSTNPPTGSSGGGGGGPTGDNTDAVNENTTAFESLTQVTDNASAALASIRNLAGNRGLGMVLDEFRSGLVGGVESLKGGMDTWTDAKTAMEDYKNRTISTFASLGISIKELHEFNTTARAASINLGGLDAWTEKLKEGQKDYFARLGSNQDAVEHQTEMMNMLVKSGGKASDLYGRFGKELMKTNDDLLKMGVTYKESREQLVGMTKDENVQQRLMSAANKQERLQIMLELQARFKHLKALGMSTEQAEAASKALAALSGKGPLDRFKEAAKMQAGMSALGIENASEVAAIVRKGDRASEEERKVVRVALGRMQEISKESRTQGLGQEMTVSQILASTGLDKLPDVFSEKLGKVGASIEQNQLDMMKVVGINTENATNIVSNIDKLNNAMEKSWIPEVPGILADIGMFVSKTGLSAAAIGTVALAVDGIQATMTGQSSTWDMVNSIFPEAAISISDTVGQFGGWVTKLVGSDEDDKQAKMEEKRNIEKRNEINNQAIANLTDTISNLEQQMAGSNATQRQALQEQIDASRRTADALEQSLEYQKKTSTNTDKKFPTKGGAVDQ